MRSGALRHRAEFSSEDGSETISRRADIKGQAQSEAIMEGEYAAGETVKVRIRYDADTKRISPRWSMAADGKNYHVESCLDMGGNMRDLSIIASRRL